MAYVEEHEVQGANIRGVGVVAIRVSAIEIADTCAAVSR